MIAVAIGILDSVISREDESAVKQNSSVRYCLCLAALYISSRGSGVFVKKQTDRWLSQTAEGLGCREIIFQKVGDLTRRTNGLTVRPEG